MKDATLQAISPIVSWTTALFGCIACPLRDTTIKALMSRSVDILVCAGGFVEAAGYSDTTEVVYSKQYTYWMKRCRENGYRLQLQLTYEGSRFYKQSAAGRYLRIHIARQGIPCIIPFPTCTKPTLFVRTMDIDLGMSLDEVNAMIVEVYDRDAEFIRREHQTIVKSIQVLSN